MPTAEELAELVAGTVRGGAAVQVSAVAPLDRAGPGDVAFAAGEQYRRAAATCGASVLVTDDHVAGGPDCQILVDDPAVAIARIAQALSAAERQQAGVHARAQVDPTAEVDPSASIGPHVTLCAGSRVGARTTLSSGVFLGRGASVGEDCVLHPNVVVLYDVTVGNRVTLHPGVVLGADGFGFATTKEGEHLKVPQLGTVIVEDDVEIGANSTVDRARFDETRIGRGSKIDNLVMIAHNVVIGPHSLIVAQAGIAGSSRLGHHVVLGGHVGVTGHVTLGDGAQVSAYSGVGSDLEGGRAYMGVPARPITQGRRIRVLEGRLPEIWKRLKQLEKRVDAGPGPSDGHEA